MKEQRENFIRDYRLGYYSVSELARRFGVSRKTCYKWISRWEQQGAGGLEEQSRRPASCPWKTAEKVCEELLRLKKDKPNRGPRKLLSTIERKRSADTQPGWVGEQQRKRTQSTPRVSKTPGELPQ